MAARSIIRRFADLQHGQLHYRTAGSGPPLVILHASPGSSRQMLGLVHDFAGRATVIAPDTPGNGDSAALPLEAPTIVDLAHAMLGFLDRMGLDRIRLYGTHTGAAIASELAILAPDRVDRLVLDGVQRLSEPQRAEILQRYALPFTPDLDGAYLMRAFQFCRDQYLFYPWYDRTSAGQRAGGLPAPRELHNLMTEVLKAAESYHLNYRAAFQWRAQDRLPLIGCPTLAVAALNDPLFDDTRSLATLLRDGRYTDLPRFDAPDYKARRHDALAGFLGLDAS